MFYFFKSFLGLIFFIDSLVESNARFFLSLDLSCYSFLRLDNSCGFLLLMSLLLLSLWSVSSLRWLISRYTFRFFFLFLLLDLLSSNLLRCKLLLTKSRFSGSFWLYNSFWWLLRYSLLRNIIFIIFWS